MLRYSCNKNMTLEFYSKVWLWMIVIKLSKTKNNQCITGKRDWLSL